MDDAVPIEFQSPPSQPPIMKQNIADMENQDRLLAMELSRNQDYDNELHYVEESNARGSHYNQDSNTSMPESRGL